MQPPIDLPAPGANIKKTIYTIFARANAARLLSAVEETVSGYKGRQSAKAVEKDFRHFVGMVVPPGGLGNRLDAMYEFQTARQLKHFRAPRFAFASVFTRASDGGIQGTGSSTLQKTSLNKLSQGYPSISLRHGPHCGGASLIGQRPAVEFFLYSSPAVCPMNAAARGF